MTRLEHVWLETLDLAHSFSMTDQAMMDGLNDIAAGNVQPASTRPTTNNTPAGTNPAVSTTTAPTNVTGVQTAGMNPAVNTTPAAGTNPAVNTTTNLQDMAMMIASLQTTQARARE